MRIWERNAGFLPACLCVLGYFLYSCGDVMRKIWGPELQFSDMLFWTNLCSVVFLLVLSPYMGGLKNTFRSRKWGTHLVRGVFNGIAALLGLYAFITLPLVEAYTIIFISPMIVTLIAVAFMGENFSFVKLVALLAGFSGVVVAMNPDFGNISLGAWAALGMTTLYSITLVLIKSLQKTETHLSLVLFPLAAACLLGWVMNGGAIHVPRFDMMLFYIALSAVSLGAMLAISKAYTMTHASSLSTLHYSQLIWGALFGFIIFAEIPTVLTYAGSAIVVFSGLLLVFEVRILAYMQRRAAAVVRQPTV